MVYNITTSNTKTKDIIKEFLEKYERLHTDKAIEKSSLSDLYTVDNNTRYYIKSGYAEEIKENFYRMYLYTC